MQSLWQTPNRRRGAGEGAAPTPQAAHRNMPAPKQKPERSLTLSWLNQLCPGDFDLLRTEDLFDPRFQSLLRF